MIAIIDYKMGNLRSVAKAIEKAGGCVEVVSTPEQLARAEKIILPGVGAFADAMEHLRERKLIEPLKQAVLEDKKLFLGICLGSQLLLSRGYEDGCYDGLDIIAGEVKPFDFSSLDLTEKLAIPHMGWNSISFNPDCPLTKGIDQGSYVYFVHGYYLCPAASSDESISCDYGFKFTAGLWRDNIFATQFHPEKSQAVGMKMLENFVAM